MDCSLSLPGNNEADIIGEHVIILTRDESEDKSKGKSEGFTLIRVEACIYRHSTYCRRMCGSFSAAQLAPYNTQSLHLEAEGNQVILMRDTNAEHFLIDCIRDFAQFKHFIDLAHMYSLDLKPVQESALLSGFLASYKRKCYEDWKHNEKLLYNTDTRAYQQDHFDTSHTEIPRGLRNRRRRFGLQQGNYDVNAPTITPGVYDLQYQLRTDKVEAPLFSQEEYDDLLAKLMAMGLRRLATQVLKATIISFADCHLALRCPQLAECADVQSRLPALFFYGFRLLYLEERKRYTAATREERYLFTGAQMRALPRFPFSINNPYFPILARGLSTLSAQLTAPSHIVGKRGLAEAPALRERINAYTGGVLEGLDWSRTALCGSTIAACAILNPLEDYHNGFARYLSEYYPAHCSPTAPGGSVEDELVELDPVEVEVRAIMARLASHRDEASEEQCEVESVEVDLNEGTTIPLPANALVPAAPPLRTDNVRGEESPTEGSPRAAPVDEGAPLPHFDEEFADIDLMIETKDYAEFDAIAASHFAIIKANAERARMGPNGPPFGRTTGGPNGPPFGRTTGGPVVLKRVPTENKYKYKITGMPREVDIFMVSSIPGTIVKFHLGCVRAWYDGTELHGFPSFVTAALLGINIDMRWISCNKDLREIILKYFQRGFMTILNARERLAIINYVCDRRNPKWCVQGMTQRLPWGFDNNAWASSLFNGSAYGIGLGYLKPRRPSANVAIDRRWRDPKTKGLRPTRHRQGAFLPHDKERDATRHSSDI